MTFTICDYCHHQIGLLDKRFTFTIKNSKGLEEVSGEFCQNCTELIRLKKWKGEQFLQGKEAQDD